jgi:Domain of unknown function (DUF4132)
MTMDSHSAEKRIGLNGGAGLLTAINGVISIAWENSSGKRQTSLPDSLKQSDPDGIDRVKKIAKDVRADLLTWKDQIERYYLEPASWQYEVWRQRYADHGTLSLLARRIIWVADNAVSFLPTRDGCVGPNGEPLEISPSAAICLWHPIHAETDEVAVWRQCLMDRGILQPFRQVWREVYRITDAERATATYSNRFAGQILRQHQMRALAIANGWHSKHRVGFDGADDDPTYLPIPNFGLQAEYWNSGLTEGQLFTSGGSYVYVKTDRLKFHRFNAKARFKRGDEVPITTVPPIVFSEVMRHCDLFTSVAAVNIDPEWTDRGANAAHPSQYDTLYRGWQEQQDRPLPPSAEVRRDMLQVIMKGMPAADRLSIDGNYIRVTGKLKRYKIHLGSAAVQLDGRQQHICIVPDNSLSPLRMFLPFECDTTLSTILSKIILLLDDDKIVDPVIVRQLDR